MKLPALLLLACLTGCMSRVDAALERAQERVYNATGRVAVPTKLYAAPFILCKDERERYVGCTDIDTGRVWVATRFSDDDLEHTLVHELFHLLGMRGHVMAGHGIMGESRSASLRMITAADLAEACAQFHCNWRRPETE